MPNWCYNNVDITATTDEQKALLQRVVDRGEDEGVFEIVRPLPEALRDTVKGTGEEDQTVFVDGCNNWYDWQVNHWGTKWDVNPIDEQFDGETLSLSFDSAWAPPIQFYEYLQELGFQVFANYYEPGMGFAGEWNDGDDFYIDDVYSLARQNPETLSTQEYHIIEMFGIREEMAQWEEDEDLIDEA